MNELIELTLPATPEYLYLARLHVGAVAVRIEMTVEEVEDLQLALGELCLTLLGPIGYGDARLKLDIGTTEDMVEVNCRIIGTGLGAESTNGNSPHAGLPPADLSKRILDALVDDHGSTAGKEPTAWLKKRRERVISPS